MTWQGAVWMRGDASGNVAGVLGVGEEFIKNLLSAQPTRLSQPGQPLPLLLADPHCPLRWVGCW